MRSEWTGEDFMISYLNLKGILLFLSFFLMFLCVSMCFYVLVDLILNHICCGMSSKQFQIGLPRIGIWSLCRSAGGTFNFNGRWRERCLGWSAHHEMLVYSVIWFLYLGTGFFLNHNTGRWVCPFISFCYWQGMSPLCISMSKQRFLRKVRSFTSLPEMYIKM